jgi:hypothetical protein
VGRVGLKVPVEGVADLPLEGAQRLLGRLALSDLLVEVGGEPASPFETRSWRGYHG